MEWKILDVFEESCRLIIKVEHYNIDGSFWFLEHYTFQGREGLKRKRIKNNQGQILLDDDTVAPYRGDNEGNQYLPEGKNWKFRTDPTLDETSIFGMITQIHKERLISGWAQQSIDVLGSIPVDKIIQRDRDGCHALVSKFAYLVGREV